MSNTVVDLTPEPTKRKSDGQVPSEENDLLTITPLYVL